MIPQRWDNHLLIIASFALGLFLAVYPLPMEWRWWRPEFVLLLAIYWISVFPLTISLVFLCAIGLYQDLLEGVPFGQHSLAMIIVAYICMMSYQRARNFALWKETGWVFLLVAVAQLPGNWVQTMGGRPISGPLLFAPALASALIWPLLRWSMDRVTRYFHIT